MKFRGIYLAAVLVLTIGLTGSPRAWAQNLYAAIHGTVTDSSGAVIPGANVVVLNTSTGIVHCQAG